MLDRKMNGTFLMGTTSSITMLAKFGEDCAMRASCRCKNVVFVFRLDALALSVIATATWLAGWLGGWVAVTLRYCIKTYRKTFSTV